MQLDHRTIEENRIRDVYSLRIANDPRYSWFNSGHLYIVQGLERCLLESIAECGFSSLEKSRILEIGCGSGHWLREFVKWGALPENVVGIDLLNDRVFEARRLCPKGVEVHCGSATELLFSSASFDLVIQCTMFTSILDINVKKQIAGEMCRVLKPKGLILWYDYHVNNPRNPNVRGIKKREVHELFPNCTIEFRNVTLAPPVARWLVSYSWLACYLLEKIPWLCTHYLAVIRKDVEACKPLTQQRK